MSAGAILGGASIGAGVGVSSVALAPFNAANTFLGSAFFGYGMILGERYMYQEDWPKIQQRLVNGEKIENIIQEYTGVFTAVVMKEAKIVFDTVTREFISIMQQALTGSLPKPVEIPSGAPTIGDPRRQPFKPEETPVIRQPPGTRKPKETIINVPKVTLGWNENAKTFQQAIPLNFKSLNKLQLKSLKNTTSLNQFIKISNSMYGQANELWQKNSSTQKNQTLKQTVTDWLAYLVQRNKTILKKIPFK